MDRSSSSESVHIQEGEVEHSYSMQPPPAHVGDDPIDFQQLLNELPSDLLQLAGSGSQAHADAAYVPDDWLASVVSDSVSWPSLSANTGQPGLQASAADVTAMQPSLQQSFLELDQMTDGALSGGSDPFFGTSPVGCNSALTTFDIDKLLADTPAANGGLSTSASMTRHSTMGESSDKQLKLFEQWLSEVNSLAPNQVTATSAAATNSATLTESVAMTPDSCSDGEKSPSTPLSTDGGYVSTSSPGSASAKSDLSSPSAIVDHLARGACYAPQLGKSVSEQVAPSSSAAAPSAVEKVHSPSSDDGDAFSLEEKEREKMSGPTAFNSESAMFWGNQKSLTEEEKEVLMAEGHRVPQQLPFSSGDVKAVKAVRRKIKNKLSAYDSRRKKKQYVEGIENSLKSAESRIAELESENRSIRALADDYAKRLKDALAGAVSQTKGVGSVGLMLLAICFVFVLPTMTVPSNGVVSLFSARTQHVVSQMPTTSPAATAFDYHVKQRTSRVLLGYSLPTSAPDLEDAKHPLGDDSSMHYVNEPKVTDVNGSASHTASANSNAVRAAVRTVNVRAGNLLITPVKQTLHLPVPVAVNS